MKVINLFGGSGLGKSTLAANIFATLKANNVNAELVLEYQKDLVYEEAGKVFWDNQILIFANQYHKLNRLIDKVDIAITDNPLLTSIVYRKYFNTPASLDVLVLDIFNSFNNINYVVKRDNSYFKQTGRTYTLEESIEIDEQIFKLLEVNNIEFKYLTNNEIFFDVIENLVDTTY